MVMSNFIEQSRRQLGASKRPSRQKTFLLNVLRLVTHIAYTAAVVKYACAAKPAKYISVGASLAFEAAVVLNHRLRLIKSRKPVQLYAFYFSVHLVAILYFANLLGHVEYKSLRLLGPPPSEQGQV